MLQKSRKKLLLLLSLTMTSLCLVLATVLAGGENGFLGGLAFPERKAAVNSSVTFNSFSNVDGVGQCQASLANGGTVRAYSTRSLSNGDVVVSSTQFVFFAYVNNGVENQNLTIGGSSREVAQFQSLSSIRVVYNGTGGMTINYSSDGSSWSTTTVSSNTSTSAIEGSKYVYLSTASGTSYASSITLNYSCNAGGDDPEPEAGLSGKYSGTYTDIEFTSSTEGTYIYGSEKLYFTYTVSGTSISFTYKSGDNTNFGSYRLFAGGSSPSVNSTGSIVSDTQISVKTYNMFDSATGRTFNK